MVQEDPGRHIHILPVLECGFIGNQLRRCNCEGLMSYTVWDGQPEEAKIELRPDGVLFSCKCPRCGGKVTQLMDPNDLIYGFEVDCTDPRCAALGEHFGFQVRMFAQWSASILGTADRELHEV